MKETRKSRLKKERI